MNIEVSHRECLDIVKDEKVMRIWRNPDVTHEVASEELTTQLMELVTTGKITLDDLAIVSQQLRDIGVKYKENGEQDGNTGR